MITLTNPLKSNAALGFATLGGIGFFFWMMYLGVMNGIWPAWLWILPHIQSMGQGSSLILLGVYSVILSFIMYAAGADSV